jgi:K+-transporting ATPase ATPase C chain
MKDLVASLRPAAVALLAFTLLTGIVYPAVVMGIGQTVFSHQANGSLIRDASGTVVGSELVGQAFGDPGYFWSRRSHLGVASGFEYNATSSVGANYGPSDGKGKPNPALVDPTKARIDALRAADPGNHARVPVDLVTASASGLDPHISPAAATYQIARIARVRGMSATTVQALVDRHTEARTLGILGELRVNVVLLNRALDAEKALPR